MSLLPSPAERQKSLAELRRHLAAQGLFGMIIPLSDAHMIEFVPDSARDLAWLTGFTGSAGTAVVLRDSAALFSDGRYSLQMAAETDPVFWSCHTILEPDQMARWIADQSPHQARIGFDASLISPPQFERWQKATRDKGLVLVALTVNPLLSLWRDRPAPPATRPWPHPAEFNGETHPLKLARLAAELLRLNADAAVITSPESIAWLLNIRAGDSDISPIALSFAILRPRATEEESRVEWFIAPDRCDPALMSHLGDSVTITPPKDFMARLQDLGAAHAKVLCDPQATSVQIITQLQESGAEVIHGNDPCLLPKALKNRVEIAGSRAAHQRDGVAMVQLLAWLDRISDDSVSELTVADQDSPISPRPPALS